MLDLSVEVSLLGPDVGCFFFTLFFRRLVLCIRSFPSLSRVFVLYVLVHSLITSRPSPFKLLIARSGTVIQVELIHNDP